jgi:ABC-type amino acid transport system permease subunit
VYVPLPVVYRRPAILGWTLYAISWITPGLHGGGIGARAFVAAVRYGVAFSIHPDSLSGCVLGLCLLIGWLANFSIFIPLPVWARIVWSAAPGLPFAAVLLLLHAPLSVRERAASLLYFYPWAVGIALIHGAYIAEARRTQPLPLM